MTAGDLPTSDDMMLHMLKFAKNGQDVSLSEIEKYLIEKFDLNDKQVKMKKRSGKETILVNRIYWTRLQLKWAGLISYTDKKAHYRITEEGKIFLNTTPKPRELNAKILMEKFPSFKNWQNEINYSKKLRREKKKSAKSLMKYYGVVILIDSLGTKGIWAKNNPEKVRNEWKEFTEEMRDKAYEELGSTSKVSFDTFSDTIIITVRTDQEKYPLYDVSQFLRPFILESMKIDRPIRGCFSVGEIFKADKIILGEAIDEADEYHRLPQWVGISACPSAHVEIEKLYREDQEKTDSFFQKYDVPLEQSVELGAWAINWPRIDDEETRIDKKIDENLEKRLDIKNALKWRNTANFFEHVVKQEPKNHEVSPTS